MLSALLLLSLSGAPDTSRLEEAMDDAQVLAALGKPDSTTSGTCLDKSIKPLKCKGWRYGKLTVYFRNVEGEFLVEGWR